MARKHVGLEYSVKTFVQDVKRQTVLDTHNIEAAANGYHEVFIPIVFPALDGNTTPSQFWLSICLIACRNCSKTARLPKMRPFLEADCG